MGSPVPPHPENGAPAAAAAEQRQINAEERATGLDERQARIDERERAIAAREAVADERDRTADRREELADERERLADQREQLADRREALADEREQALNELEARIDGRARALGVPTETVDERVLETIARGRALLNASIASLDRSELAVARARARGNRDQQEIDRETVSSEHELAGRLAGDRTSEQSLLTRSQDLRDHFLALAGELAAAEDDVADLHERRRGTLPGDEARHTAVAEKAREAARRVREAASKIRGQGGRDAPS